MSGLAGYLAGRAAEEAVLRHYEARGFHKLATRWRSRAGEIDLVMANGPEIIFVEVKAARDLAAAAARLTMRQLARIARAAEEFLSGQPLGSLTPARIDAAFVDRFGRIELIENAYMA
jgi:putative endonuclease